MPMQDSDICLRLKNVMVGRKRNKGIFKRRNSGGSLLPEARVVIDREKTIGDVEWVVSELGLDRILTVQYIIYPASEFLDDAVREVMAIEEQLSRSAQAKPDATGRG